MLEGLKTDAFGVKPPAAAKTECICVSLRVHRGPWAYFFFLKMQIFSGWNKADGQRWFNRFDETSQETPTKHQQNNEAGGGL